MEAKTRHSDISTQHIYQSPHVHFECRNMGEPNQNVKTQRLFVVSIIKVKEHDKTVKKVNILRWKEGESLCHAEVECSLSSG